MAFLGVDYATCLFYLKSKATTRGIFSEGCFYYSRLFYFHSLTVAGILKIMLQFGRTKNN